MPAVAEAVATGFEPPHEFATIERFRPVRPSALPAWGVEPLAALSDPIAPMPRGHTSNGEWVRAERRCNGTLVCCLPGSTNACRTAWNKILVEQLDSRTKPCNFVPHLKASAVDYCGPRS